MPKKKVKPRKTRVTKEQVKEYRAKLRKERRDKGISRKEIQEAREKVNKQLGITQETVDNYQKYGDLVFNPEFQELVKSGVADKILKLKGQPVVWPVEETIVRPAGYDVQTGEVVRREEPTVEEKKPRRGRRGKRNSKSSSRK